MNKEEHNRNKPHQDQQRPNRPTIVTNDDQTNPPQWPMTTKNDPPQSPPHHPHTTTMPTTPTQTNQSESNPNPIGIPKSNQLKSKIQPSESKKTKIHGKKSKSKHHQSWNPLQTPSEPTQNQNPLTSIVSLWPISSESTSWGRNPACHAWPRHNPPHYDPPPRR